MARPTACPWPCTTGRSQLQGALLANIPATDAPALAHNDFNGTGWGWGGIFWQANRSWPDQPVCQFRKPIGAPRSAEAR